MIWTVSKHVDQLIELVCKVDKSAHARPSYVKIQKVDFSSSATGHNPYHGPHIFATDVLMPGETTSALHDERFHYLQFPAEPICLSLSELFAYFYLNT